MRGAIVLAAAASLAARECDVTSAAARSPAEARAIPSGQRAPSRAGAPEPAGAPFVNLMDYGAAGDGVADDSAALEAALIAARASDRTLFLPAGTYRVATTFTIRGRIRIEGSGTGSTVVLSVAGTGPLLTIYSGDDGASGVIRNVNLSRLTLRRDPASSVGPLLYLRNVQDSSVSELLLGGAPGAGAARGAANLRVEGSIFNVFSRLRSTASTGNGLLVTDGGGGATVAGANLNTFINPVVAANDGSQIRIEHSTGNTLIDPNVSDAAARGFDLVEAHNTKIIGGWTENIATAPAVDLRTVTSIGVQIIGLRHASGESNVIRVDAAQGTTVTGVVSATTGTFATVTANARSTFISNCVAGTASTFVDDAGAGTRIVGNGSDDANVMRGPFKVATASGTSQLVLVDDTSARPTYVFNDAGALRFLNGAAAETLGAIADDPAAGETVLRLRYNGGASVTVQQVTVGAPNTGGPGFRILRVPN